MKKQYSSTAKVILLGEHAVLRGSSAIVMPLNSFKLTLRVQAADRFMVGVAKNFDQRLVTIIKKIINGSPNLEFYLSGNFPVGQGLGFSAALCVVLAKWLIEYNGLGIDYIELAKSLEMQFHGKSSGLDIVGVSTNSMQLFKSIQEYDSIEPQWQPKLFVSLFDKQQPTKSCVSQVEQNTTKNLDGKMALAVKRAHSSLLSLDESLYQLASAIQLAHECFVSWGLVDAWQQDEMDFLKKQGALAVKPTGAGGSSLISLWDQDPPHSLNLIRL